MTERCKDGDHVTWDSETGPVSRKIIKARTQDVTYKGVCIMRLWMSRNMK